MRLTFFTELLSAVSDRLFGTLASSAAKKYSHSVNTPGHFVELLLLIEDKRFPLHFGIDPIAIIRALIFNARGCVLQGASTIPQQVFNIRIKRHSNPRIARTMLLKLRQAAWAMAHSALVSRTAVLREYLGAVYWGRSLYGIDEAASAYFHTNRSSLSPAQSFFLVERIAMPNRFSGGRISNLLRRRAIRDVLVREQTSVEEVAMIYREFCDLRGEIWRLQEK